MSSQIIYTVMLVPLPSFSQYLNFLEPRHYFPVLFILRPFISTLPFPDIIINTRARVSYNNCEKYNYSGFCVTSYVKKKKLGTDGDW